MHCIADFVIPLFLSKDQYYISQFENGLKISHYAKLALIVLELFAVKMCEIFKSDNIGTGTGPPQFFKNFILFIYFFVCAL